MSYREDTHGNILYFKVLLGQSGSSALSLSKQYENDLGEAPSYLRGSAGDYELDTTHGLFTPENTFVHAPNITPGSTALVAHAAFSDSNTISIQCRDAAGSLVYLGGSMYFMMEVNLDL